MNSLPSLFSRTAIMVAASLALLASISAAAACDDLRAAMTNTSHKPDFQSFDQLSGLGSKGGSYALERISRGPEGEGACSDLGEGTGDQSPIRTRRLTTDQPGSLSDL